MARHDFVFIDPRPTPELDDVRRRASDIEIDNNCTSRKSAGACIAAAVQAVLARCGPGDRLGTLDLVGHGASGQLSFGALYTLNSDRDSQEWLAPLRRVVDVHSHIRLIGCGVALSGLKPKDYSGPALLLTLSHFLGARVSAPCGPVFSSDFEAHGLSNTFPIESFVTASPVDGTLPVNPPFYDRFRGSTRISGAQRQVMREAHRVPQTPGTAPRTASARRAVELWQREPLPRRADSNVLALPEASIAVGSSAQLNVLLGGRVIQVQRAGMASLAVPVLPRA